MRLAIKFWKTFWPRNNRTAYANVIHVMHEVSRPIRTEDLIGCHGNKAKPGSLGEVTVNELVAMTTARVKIKKILLPFLPPSVLSSFLSSHCPLDSTLYSTTPFHPNSLHSTPLRSTPLHSTPLRSAPLHSTPLHSTPLHRPFASSAENRTRASRFGGGVPTTALSNGRCRG